jgi:hypothetical protein
MAGWGGKGTAETIGIVCDPHCAFWAARKCTRGNSLKINQDVSEVPLVSRREAAGVSEREYRLRRKLN